MNLPQSQIMIKAARKAAANAELARAFADIFTNRLRFVSAAHYEQCTASQSIIATQGRQSGRRGAGCECVEHCGSALARSNAGFNHLKIKAARKAPGIAQTLSYESAAMLTATDIMNDGDPCGSPFFL